MLLNGVSCNCFNYNVGVMYPSCVTGYSPFINSSKNKQQIYSYLLVCLKETIVLKSLFLMQSHDFALDLDLVLLGY